MPVDIGHISAFAETLNRFSPGLRSALPVIQVIDQVSGKLSFQDSRFSSLIL
jgi:hypothetical protein